MTINLTTPLDYEIERVHSLQLEILVRSFELIVALSKYTSTMTSAGFDLVNYRSATWLTYSFTSLYRMRIL